MRTILPLFAAIALTACASEAVSKPVPGAPSTEPVAEEGARGTEPSQTKASDECVAQAGVKQIDSSFETRDVSKFLVSPGGVHWIVDDRLLAWPDSNASKSLGLSSGDAFVDLALSQGRLYTLDSSGFIEWRSPMGKDPRVVTAFAKTPYALHVDDQYVYFSGTDTNESRIARYGRDHQSQVGLSDYPETILTGPAVPWLAGTATHLYMVPNVASAAEIDRAEKPNGRNPERIAVFEYAKITDFTLDEKGMVVVARSNAKDEIFTVSFDGTKKLIASGAAKAFSHMSAAGPTVFFTDGDTIKSVPRDGGAAATTVVTSSCRVTNLGAGSDAIYFATIALNADRQSVWRMTR
jgi:hypothetical protein